MLLPCGNSSRHRFLIPARQMVDLAGHRGCASCEHYSGLAAMNGIERGAWYASAGVSTARRVLAIFGHVFAVNMPGRLPSSAECEAQELAGRLMRAQRRTPSRIGNVVSDRGRARC